MQSVLPAQEPPLTSALAAGLSCASTTRKRAICVALSRCVLSAVFVPAPNGALEASLGGSWSGPRTKERLNKGIRYFPISAAIPLRIRTKNSTAPLTSSTNSIRKSGFINSSLRIVTTPGLLSGKMKCKTSIYFSYYFLSEELRNTIRYCPQREQHFGRRYGTSLMHTNLCNFDHFRGRVVYKTGSSLPMREHCEIVEIRNSADVVGYSCSRTASTQCSDCGSELCKPHAENCDTCRSIFCPSCFLFHQSQHSKAPQRIANNIKSERTPSPQRLPAKVNQCSHLSFRLSQIRVASSC